MKRATLIPMSLLIILSSLVLGSMYVFGIGRSSPPLPADGGLKGEQSDIRLVFGGDMMFDRSIRQQIQNKGPSFILNPMHAYLASQDLVIANVEGPITEYSSQSVNSAIGSKENYSFTFDPGTAALLADENIHVVNIGNNHIGNFGANGITQTKQYLQNAGVRFFGNTGQKDEKRYLVVTVKGKRISFVNYNQFVLGGANAALSDISEAKKESDMVTVYTHWGLEYLPTAPKVVQELAHQLIDAGADLIIGSHPHVVEQKEVYKGKTIYYSLGNFVFDQYLQPETQHGLLVEVKIDPTTMRLQLNDVRIQLRTNGQTVLEK